MPFRIRVRRFEPAIASEASWVNYDVPLDGARTVLDALLFIEEHQDPTLAFRRMCRSGICGTCAGLVNGTPRLFCQTLLREAARRNQSQPDIILEPLPQFDVLRDLVVDIDAFFRDLESAEAWLIPNSTYNGVIPRQLVERLWPVARCILCGICADQEFGPGRPHAATVARVLRFADDPRDAKGPARRAILDLFSERERRRLVGLLRAVCPADVELEPLLTAERPSE